MRKIVRSSNNGQNRLPVDLVKANETVLKLRQSMDHLYIRRRRMHKFWTQFLSAIVSNRSRENYVRSVNIFYKCIALWVETTSTRRPPAARDFGINSGALCRMQVKLQRRSTTTTAHGDGQTDRRTSLLNALTLIVAIWVQLQSILCQTGLISHL